MKNKCLKIYKKNIFNNYFINVSCCTSVLLFKNCRVALLCPHMYLYLYLCFLDCISRHELITMKRSLWGMPNSWHGLIDIWHSQAQDKCFSRDEASKEIRRMKPKWTLKIKRRGREVVQSLVSSCSILLWVAS